jgi:hypothetical protein
MTQNVSSAITDQINQVSRFRLWVNEVWRENCEERLTYHQDPATIKEYWNAYKYWLKREYKHQRTMHDIRSKATETV